MQEAHADASGAGRSGLGRDVQPLPGALLPQPASEQLGDLVCVVQVALEGV